VAARQPPNRQEPISLIQVGGRVAEGVVSGFGGSPALLLIVILNVVMILSAGYFLAEQDKLQAKVVVSLIEACFKTEVKPEGELQ
jgi:hypothetical protein